MNKTFNILEEARYGACHRSAAPDTVQPVKTQESPTRARHFPVQFQQRATFLYSFSSAQIQRYIHARDAALSTLTATFCPSMPMAHGSVRANGPAGGCHRCVYMEHAAKIVTARDISASATSLCLRCDIPGCRSCRGCKRAASGVRPIGSCATCNAIVPHASPRPFSTVWATTHPCPRACSPANVDGWGSPASWRPCQRMGGPLVTRRCARCPTSAGRGPAPPLAPPPPARRRGRNHGRCCQGWRR